MLALIYRRVSSEDQARKGYSLPEQYVACRERALRSGATEVLDFADEGAPGDVLNRPALSAIRDRLRLGGVALVVVLDPDRLARSLIHQLILTEEIERAGARLEFVNFEWQQTPEGRLFYSLRGAVSEYEKAKILERTARGRLGKARQGRRTHYIPVYGYRQVPDGLEIDEEQARWVRLIFAWVAGERLGPAAVADRLNRMGVPSPRRKAWRPGVVARMLSSPTYAGLLYQHRWDAAGARRNRFLPPSERRPRVERDRSEWLPMTVPAVVEQELWEAVQAVRSSARARCPGLSRHSYVLRGLLACGACGGPVRGAMGYGRGRHPYRYYRCSAGCAGAVRADELEAAVWAAVCGFLKQAWVRPTPTPTPARRGAGERAALESELSGALAEQARVLDLAARGLVEMELAAERLVGVRERLLRLRAALGAAVTEPRPEAEPPGPSRLDLPARQRLLRLLVQRAELRSCEVSLLVRAAAPPSAGS